MSRRNDDGQRIAPLAIANQTINRPRTPYQPFLLRPATISSVTLRGTGS